MNCSLRCPETGKQLGNMWTFQVGSDARIDQLEGRSPESCLSWLRSHEGCPAHDLFMLEYSRCARF